MSVMPPTLPPAMPPTPPAAPPTAVPVPRIFTPGRWLYCWPRSEREWLKFEPTPAFLATMKQHGIDGLIVHSVCPVPESMIESSEWCTPGRVEAFENAGIRIVIGVGMRAPPYWERLAKDIIQAITACKRASWPCRGVNCDWEGSWDGHKAEAKLLIAAVIEVHPDAGLYLTMPSWWAPENLPDWTDSHGVVHHGGATHPRAPTKEWLDIIALDVPIDPQCYGAPKEGESKRMLVWSRRQYGLHYGLPAWRVIPGVQLYHRSLFDHLDLLLTEDTISMWDWLEADAIARHALRIAKVLRDTGIHGAGWVRMFQAAYQLKVDGIVGPKTLAALAAVTA